MNKQLVVTCRRQHSIIAHAAAQESQDVDDLEAEIEEEMENAYEEGVNVDVVPGAQAAKLASQRMRRQENTDSRSRRKSEEDAFDQRILQVVFTDGLIITHTAANCRIATKHAILIRLICCGLIKKKGCEVRHTFSSLIL